MWLPVVRAGQDRGRETRPRRPGRPVPGAFWRHGQHATQHGHDRHQRDCRQRRQDAVERVRRVQPSGTSTATPPPWSVSPKPGVPLRSRHPSPTITKPADRRRRQPDADRQHALVDGIADPQPDPDEQDDQPDAGDGVAARHEVPHATCLRREVVPRKQRLARRPRGRRGVGAIPSGTRRVASAERPHRAASRAGDRLAPARPRGTATSEGSSSRTVASSIDADGAARPRGRKWAATRCASTRRSRAPSRTRSRSRMRSSVAEPEPGQHADRHGEDTPRGRRPRRRRAPPPRRRDEEQADAEEMRSRRKARRPLAFLPRPILLGPMRLALLALATVTVASAQTDPSDPSATRTATPRARSSAPPSRATAPTTGRRTSPTPTAPASRERRPWKARSTGSWIRCAPTGSRTSAANR